LGTENGRLRNGHGRTEVVTTWFSLIVAGWIVAFDFLKNQVSEHGAGDLVFFPGAWTTSDELS
jgi:hypothetical protein